LGLRKFVREFVFKPGNGFTISDEIETARMSVLTSLLHADHQVETLSANRFAIKSGAAKLLVERQGDSTPTQATIAINDLTAPGPPGSVDKGERQERGQKLVLTTAPVTKARFVTRLKVE
jgi:hypothetical protein